MILSLDLEDRLAVRDDVAIRMRLADGSEHPYPGTFRAADRAVYAAKDEGRDRVRSL